MPWADVPIFPIVRLGDLVRDEITGFEGIAIGRTTYLYGCVQVWICPNKLGPEGKRLDSEWFDEQRVKLLERRAVPMNPTDADAGGPSLGPNGPVRG